MKAVLVTGATTPIGRSIVEALLANAEIGKVLKALRILGLDVIVRPRGAK